MSTRRFLLPLLSLVTTLLAAPSAAEALTVTSLTAPAKPLRCSASHPGVCEFAFTGDLPTGAMQEAVYGRVIHFSYDGLDVYRGKAVHGLRHSQLGSRTIWTMRLKGQWLVSEAMAREIVGSQTTLTMTAKPATAALAAAPRARRQSAYQLSAYADDPDVNNAVVAPARPARPARPMMAMAEPGAVEVEDDAPPGPSAFTRFENWATGADAPNARIASLIVKGGSPLSPTGMEGGCIEFFPAPVLPIRIGGGSYDSTQVFNHGRGSVSYGNFSLGTGLLIGRKNGQLDLGLDMVRINATFHAAPAGSTGVAADAKSTYSGYVPHVGLRLVSDSELILSFELGRFLSSGGDDPFAGQGAPVAPTASVSAYKNTGTTLNIGLGTYL